MTDQVRNLPKSHNDKEFYERRLLEAEATLEEDRLFCDVFGGRFVFPNLHGHQGGLEAGRDGEGGRGDNAEEGGGQERVQEDESEQGGARAGGGADVTRAEYEASLGWRNLTDDEFRCRDPAAFGPCRRCSRQLHRAMCACGFGL